MAIIEHELVQGGSDDEGLDWQATHDEHMAKVARHVARAREMMKDQRHGFALFGTTPEGQLILALEALLGAFYTPEEELAQEEGGIVDETREALAAYAHSAWAGWMHYLFGKAVHRTDGAILIPEWAARRWVRQAATPYADLPEAEKESDRAEADKILAIVRQPDALALATASLLDQAAGVAELLQEAGDYLDDLLATRGVASLVNREAGADLVTRIAQALHEARSPEGTCPACGTPLLRRAGRAPTCPNDLCNYVARGGTAR